MINSNDFIFRAVITENGGDFHSHCLDIDISSHGSTVEEAKLNLMKQFESRFKCIATPLKVDLKNQKSVRASGNYIIDEFYFEHKLSSFAAIEPVIEEFKPEINNLKEFDKGFIFIKH